MNDQIQIPAVHMENVCKTYGKTRALQNLSLTIQPQDFCGLIGPNGAGKSTTLRLLTRLVRKDAGTLEIFGDPAGLESAPVSGQIGYMPSDAMFPRGMKVRDVLKLAARTHQSDCLSYGLELCQRLDLDPKKKAGTLSLGNRKKLGIVCAMQHKPALLILDEPASGLDPLIQQVFFDLLKEAHAAGITILFSSHNLNEVENLCSRLLFIDQGKVILDQSRQNFLLSRQLQVHVRSAAPLARIEGSELWKQTCQENDGSWSTSFLFPRDPEMLMKRLLDSHIPLEDVQIVHPDLESRFLAYYEGQTTGETS